MIQLYRASTPASVLQGLTRNGDRALEARSAIQHLVLNGPWDLELSLPQNGNQTDIEVGATIRVPAHNGTDQLYRVYEVTPSLADVVIKASPIFMQAQYDVFLADVRPTNQTGQAALNQMISEAIASGSGYTYSANCNITTTNTAYYIRKNLIEAIQGNDDQSFLNRWGGEVYYDNLTINIRTRQGADRGIACRYGYNMSGCSQRVNTDNVITRLVPVAYNGRTLPGLFVDSPLIRSYPFVRTQVVNYDDLKLTEDIQSGEETDSYDSLDDLHTAMIARAERAFSEGKIDLPEISYDISLASLEGSLEYAGINKLNEIYLGDTVHVYNERLGIETSARVVEIYWDCNLKRVDRVILGDYRDDYFSRLSTAARTVETITDKDGNVHAERVAGIINGMVAQLRVQNTSANRADVRALLFEDLDTTSPLYGAMCIGTQGFQIANERLSDGSDWDWRTFGTANGFSADMIIAGILASQNFDGGSHGVAIDLNRGILYAPEFTIASTNVDGWDSLSGDVNSLSSKYGTLSRHFSVGEWGPNDEYGAAVVVDNNMVLVSGKAVSLIQDGNITDPVAILSQQKLEVTHGVFKSDLTIGAFKWIPRSNGGLSLVYIGG